MSVYAVRKFTIFIILIFNIAEQQWLFDLNEKDSNLFVCLMLKFMHWKKMKDFCYEATD